jgi:hypothetical protein
MTLYLLMLVAVSGDVKIKINRLYETDTACHQAAAYYTRWKLKAKCVPVSKE